MRNVKFRDNKNIINYIKIRAYKEGNYILCESVTYSRALVTSCKPSRVDLNKTSITALGMHICAKSNTEF